MTSPHLLVIALGPVQDFIFQARRSRDLWFGSHLLSELSRAAARSLAGDGDLVFPSLAEEELKPCDGPTRPGGQPPVTVVNKIIAEIPPNKDPAVCARRAREAVRNEWDAIAARVKRCRLKDQLLPPDIDAVWKEQVDDILEFYATWVPLGDDYNAARAAAEQVLAGRKNLRDFRAWKVHRPGAPKSSLDGARVSVLRKGNERADYGAYRRFRITEGEQLDAIGVIKRTGFDPEQFIPLANIAAADWLRRAEVNAKEQLADVRMACSDRGIPRVERDLPAVAAFQYDASVLYPSRWAPLFEELHKVDNAATARAWGECHIRPLLKQMKEPPAYVACLVADGDHMGAAISKLETAQDNRDFSAALAKFPTAARCIVEQTHRGGLIFAGGDDVLAFLPVATACACAAELAGTFHHIMEAAAPAGAVPTLSVGIAIGHMLESMSVLLAVGRQAERAAKDAGRNALAVIIDKRSGGRRQFGLCWITQPVERLRHDAELLATSLSTGKVHELEALLRRFPDPHKYHVPDPASVGAALVAYAADILAHTGDGTATTSLCQLGIHAPQPDYTSFRKTLQDTINRLLVVREMRAAGFA
ncbi:MAG TPA: type III-B CRISPR-associated protein Cas10/Cmr2 [Acetobacteraceae bacterium]|nr:type III-B CRISPR-associated protein Cas10/Cmr2 [Acetobacteraceae bacterium]